MSDNKTILSSYKNVGSDPLQMIILLADTGGRVRQHYGMLTIYNMNAGSCAYQYEF